ncbi:MAG: UDP-glucose 4-epimerase GalE [Aquisalimonadaceae bacterium]
MRILIAGGAGYIGSHMVKLLGRAGADLVILDDLSNGYADAITAGEFIRGDLGDAALLRRIVGTGNFDAVMHFGAFIEVGESVADPLRYYQNNVAATVTLLREMQAAGIRRFVFSSTAAIFGEPLTDLIDEDHPKRPINPYGRSKLMVETLLEDCDAAFGLKSCCLRYFNAAGADPEGQLGERHEPETHLIPLVLQAASGRRRNIRIFGTDFPTPDGTAVRDFIHVDDLCQAHQLALDHLLAGGDSARFNLGNGKGYSVRQVIDTVAKVTGRQFEVEESDRRLGDPARLVADSQRIKAALGWNPKHDLETIIRDAWQWEQKISTD